MKKYLIYLYKQYCDAKDLDKDNTNNLNTNDFINWIIHNKFLLTIYFDYLNSLDFDYSLDDILEVGKGKYDSMSYYGINIASIFAESLGKINSKLLIVQDIPVIISNNNIEVPKEHIILTHNPYFENEIIDWYLIHNSGDKNISIGMFGNITDKNVAKKIKLLEYISKQMTDDYLLSYDTNNGNYFCSLNSKRHTKIKVLKK